MADSKISDLTALTGAGVADNDDLVIVDTDADATKRISAAEFAAYLGAELQSAIEEYARDAVATALTAGSNITITPNDGANTITIASSGSAVADDLFGPVPSGAYVGQWLTYGNNNKTTTLNRVVYTPVFIPHSITADRIACVLGTAGSAGAVVRLGIYAPHATTGRPDALVLDAGTFAADSTTGFKEITISQALGAGLHWLACVSQTATCALRAGQGIGGFYHWSSDQTATQTPGSTAWIQNSVSGALPSTATPAINGNDAPGFNLWVRAT